MKPDTFFYGGQAVIEGVLMRGRTTYAVAVRKPDGEILVTRERLRSPVYTSRFWKLPFLRGLAGLWEMLHLGMKALVYSANIQAKGADVELSPQAIAITVTLAVIFGVLVFLGLPLLGAGLLGQDMLVGGPLPAIALVGHAHGALRFTLVEGAIRIGLLLAYLYLISLTKDIRRVFQYHGAEHKTINAFEAGLPMEVAQIRTQSTLHPRCGTGFLLAVMIVSVFVFSLVGRPALVWLLLSRLLLVPVIAMVAYECIRFFGRHRRNPVVKVLVLPLLATQKLTTREPDDNQIAVALAAFNGARQEETEAAA